MRSAARLFVVVFLFLSAFLIFKGTSFAQSSAYIPPNTNANVPLTMHTYTQSLTLEAISSVFCLLAGIDPANPSQPCLGFDPNTHKIGYVQSTGLLGAVSGMTAALFTPPVHAVDYLSYAAHNFGLAKKTYAATASNCNINESASGFSGVGFCGINPLTGIWTVSRNIVYLFFVIAFILIGFGIMLRMKIDPRTVMSIENQIPKLIIALILVTFSFAIAGIMIDAMWVGSFVVVNVITSADQNNPDPQFTAQTVNNNFFQNPLGFANNVLPGHVVGLTAGAAGSIGDVIRGMLTPNNSNSLGLTPEHKHNCQNHTPLVGWIGTGFCNLGGAIGDAIAGAIGYFVSWIISILALLVILIAIIYTMFRVWFTLLLSYAYILLDIILGPFMIAFGVLPGSKVGFGSWARDILANLMAFPTTIAMFLLARILMDSFTTNGGTSSLFVTPLIGNPNGTAGSGNPLGFLIALAIILMTPQAINITKSALKVQSGKLGQQVFQGLGKGTEVTGKVISGYTQAKFGQLTEYKQNGIQATQGLKRYAQAFGLIK